jgi:hypothetical protein
VVQYGVGLTTLGTLVAVYAPRLGVFSHRDFPSTRVSMSDVTLQVEVLSESFLAMWALKEPVFGVCNHVTLKVELLCKASRTVGTFEGQLFPFLMFCYLPFLGCAGSSSFIVLILRVTIILHPFIVTIITLSYP